MKKIKLPHNHRHGGVDYKAGETIELDDAAYEWFIKATYNLRTNDREELSKIVGTNEWADRIREEQAKPRKAKKGDDDGDDS